MQATRGALDARIQPFHQFEILDVALWGELTKGNQRVLRVLFRPISSWGYAGFRIVLVGCFLTEFCLSLLCIKKNLEPVLPPQKFCDRGDLVFFEETDRLELFAELVEEGGKLFRALQGENRGLSIQLASKGFGCGRMAESVLGVVLGPRIPGRFHYVQLVTYAIAQTFQALIANRRQQILCGDTVRQVWLNGSEKPERPMFIASGGLGSFCQNEPVVV